MGLIGPMGPMRLMGLMRLMRLMGLIGLMSLMGCRGVTAEEQASLAAKGYYEHLVAGEYDAYLEGVSGLSSASADYRQQLRLGTEQYMKRVEALHQGIKTVEVSSARTDSTLHCVYVFLTLGFGDNTKEEICVPMVEQAGVYQMR